MKRIAFGIALLMLVAGAAADSLFSVHDKVKTVLEGQFSRTLGRAVRIERLEGNLYQRIVMRNVAVANTDSFSAGVLASAQTIEIRYSLKGALFDNFDILAHVRQIKVVRPRFALKRNRDGAWNFLPTQNTTEEPQSIQAKLLVTVVDGSGTFEDRRGWGAKPTVFATTVTTLNTTLAFANEHLTVQGTAAVLGQTGAMPVAVAATYDLLARRGQLKIQSAAVDLGFLNKYLQLPLAVAGRAGVSVNIALRGAQTAVDYAVAGEKIDVAYQGYSGKNMSGLLKKNGDILELTLRQARFGGGVVSGNILFSLRDNRLLPQSRVYLTDVRAEQLLPATLLTGGLTGSLTCTGSTENVLFAVAFPQLRLTTQNQVLSAVAVSGSITDDGLTYTANLCVNDVWSRWTGRCAEQWSAQALNQPLRLTYVQEGPFAETDVQITLNGEYRFQPRHNTTFADFSVHGAGSVAGEILESFSARTVYQNGMLTVPHFELHLPHSFLVGTASVSRNFRLDIAEARLDMRDSRWLQTMFPESSGTVALSGYYASGTTPNATFTVQADQLRYEDIFIRSAATQVAIAGTRYTIPEYRIDLDGNVFSGSGLWQQDATGNLFTMQNGLAQFELTTTRTDLQLLNRLVKKTQEQSRLFSARLENLATKNIRLPVLTIGQQVPLYAEYVADRIQEYRQYSNVSTENGKTGPTTVTGILSGAVRLHNDHGVLSIDADAQINSGKTQYADWDTLQCVVQTTGPTINVAAFVKQLLVSPSVEIPMLTLRAAYADGMVFVEECQLRPEAAPPSSIVSGSFPVAAFWDEQLRDTPFQLQVTIHGDELNLLTPYLQNVAYIHNDGLIDMVCSGTYRSWQLSANTLQLKDFTMGLRNPYFQQLQIKKAQLKLDKNILDIAACDIQLVGNQKTTPVFKLSGTLGTEAFSFAALPSLKVSSRLLLKDMEQEEILIKNIYDGSFSLYNASLVGTFTVPLSPAEKEKQYQRIKADAEEGPLLTAQLQLLNGTLYLFAIEKDISVKSDKFVSLQLDADIRVKNDVRVQTRDSILSGDVNMLSQLNVGIRDNNPPVKISGTLNYFKIAGLLYFDDGYVSILNRTFTLLDKQEQSTYLRQSERHAGDNYLEFRETAQFTLDPHFSFAALTTVVDTVLVSNNTTLAVSENAENAAEPLYTTDEKEYIVFIDGSIFDLASFSFQRYRRQNATVVVDGDPYVLKDAGGRMIDNYRFKELMYELAPSAVKTMWRASAGETAGTWGSATKEMVRDMSATEINFLVRTMIRPVERKVAQSLNLYDIKFKRDVGNKDVVSRLSFLQDTSQTVVQSETQLLTSQELSVQMVKDLWHERLFLSVDTSLDRNLQTNITQYTLYSWKLTYRFLKDFSLFFVVLDQVDLNYGNERDTVMDTYIPVLSLEAIHSF